MVKEIANKRRNIYFGNEEILAKLDKEGNRSKLIEQLLTDFYNKDLEYLESKKEILTEELAIIKMKIDTILEKREEIRKLDKEKSKKEDELKETKELADGILNKWRSREITEKEYWSCFKGGKLNIKRVRKLLK